MTELILTPVVGSNFCYLPQPMLLLKNRCYFRLPSDAFQINNAVLKVILIKPWVNTNLSDSKTEREVKRYQVGLSFLIVNLGMPWTFLLN